MNAEESWNPQQAVCDPLAHVRSLPSLLLTGFDRSFMEQLANASNTTLRHPCVLLAMTNFHAPFEEFHPCHLNGALAEGVQHGEESTSSFIAVQ